MRKIYAKSVSSVLSNKQKEIHIGDSREMVELITPDPRLLGSLVSSEESRIYCYDPEAKRQSAQWKHPDSPRPKKARQSKSTVMIMIPFFDVTGIIYVRWVPSGETVKKEYIVDILRDFFVKDQRSSIRVGSQLNQNNAPVNNFILVTKYLTEMGVKTVPHPPYNPDP